MSSDRVAPLSEHLDELSKRLRVVLYFLIASTVIIMALPADLSFISNPLVFYTPLISLVLKRVTHDILPPEFVLVGYTVGAPIELYVIASLILGILVSIPVIAYEIYRFVTPALYEKEKRAVGPFVISFSTLFAIGAAFGYFIIAPFTMWAMVPFFAAVGAQPMLSVIDFYSVVFSLILMAGLTFTFPVFLVLLVRFGIISIQVVTKNRRYIYAGLFVITAVITPDGGPIADVVLFIPIILLLEIAVLVSRRYEQEGARTTLPFFEPEPRCRFCGAEMSSRLKFCRRCGKSQS